MLNPTLIVISWLIIGPAFPFAIAISILVIGLMPVLRHRFHHKTVALISLMGFMFVQSILIVFLIHLRFGQPVPPPNSTLRGAWLFQALFGLDLRLAELGAIAAICVGVYIEFGRSRLGLSQMFPNSTFSEPTRDLVRMAKRLSKSAGIQRPELCLIDSGSPSAFAVRTKSKYTVAVSVGLLESLDTNEVEACIAHEVSHIKNRDFALRLIVTIARIALFTRLLSYFIETAFYRTRELLADRTVANLIGGPGPLISALTKMQQANCSNETLVRSPVCCFLGKKHRFEVLSRHPNLSTRIALLRELELVENATDEVASKIQWG
ncbi:MAG: M48 family metalloprotease [Candidatus Bathyarchaeia archaeon]|jgi:heat shock protein HtpX